MEKLQLFLSEGDEILSDSTLDVETLVEVLTEIVSEERKKLEAEKDYVQKLKVDLEKSTSERDVCLSSSAQVLDLEPALMEEQRAQERLEGVSSLLEHLMYDTSEEDTSIQNDMDLSQHLEDKVASVEEQEHQLSAGEQQLHEQLEGAQADLTKIHEQQHVANEELCALQQQCSSEHSVVSPRKTKTDRLLDDCLERLALLRHLTKKK